MNYVILAAGEGSRFVKEGVSTPKPLVSVMGEPMIGRLIHVLERSSAEKIVVVSNSRMNSLTEYLEGMRQKCNVMLDIRPIVSDSSYYSLLCGAQDLQGKFIALTVDTIFPTEEFSEFVHEVDKLDIGEVLMGLTRYVDDESPLYAEIGTDGTVVNYKYGGTPFPGEIIVSAGVYGLTSTAMELISMRKSEPDSLSDFQRILAAETDIRVKVFEFSKAMDVDRLHDREAAERFIREFQA